MFRNFMANSSYCCYDAKPYLFSDQIVGRPGYLAFGSDVPPLRVVTRGLDMSTSIDNPVTFWIGVVSDHNDG
jgi:hypothetical protein